MSLPLLQIYTDGSCSPNPGPGGWGVVILPEKGKKRELSGRVEGTTNNRMELQAALEAFRSLPVSSEVQLYTDSQYVKNGITSWLRKWQQGNWMTSTGEKVKNRDLWEELEQSISRHRVNWIWVKGHADNPHNERADNLAVLARGREVLPLGDEAAVHIFLGITWKQKAKHGSWAAVLRYQRHMKVIGSTVTDSTANRIHIQSAAVALKNLKKRIPVHFYTSSGYLKEGAESWLKGWQKNNWLTREGKEVSNREAWKELKQILDDIAVRFYVIDKGMPPCLSQEAKELAREWVAELEVITTD